MNFSFIQQTLNTTSYVAFVNVELDSDVQKGSNGNVNGHGQTNVTKDLSTDGTTSTVRANRDLFIYNTANSTVTRITEGTDMTEYLNTDNTMKDKYRLVDVLYGDEKKVDRQIITWRGMFLPSSSMMQMVRLYQV